MPPKSKSTKKPTARKKPTGSKENRGNPRIPVQLLVDYHCEGNYLFDFCRDLGTGGVFIETKSPMDVGSKVSLTFTLPDSKETLETSGEVIWVQNECASQKKKGPTPGMGVQFESFDKSQRKVLEEFVHRYHSGGLNQKSDDKSA